MVTSQQTHLIENTAKLGQNWEWIMVTGVIFTSLGVLTSAVSYLIETKLNVLIAVLFLSNSGFRFLEAALLRNNIDSTRRLFMSILPLIAGIMFVRFQNLPIGGISLIYIFYFFTSASTQLIRLSDFLKISVWRWSLVSVTISIILGGYVLLTIPTQFTDVLSNVLSLDLLAIGIAKIGLSLSLKKFSDQFYSAKMGSSASEYGGKDEYQREPMPSNKRDESGMARHDRP